MKLFAILTAIFCAVMTVLDYQNGSYFWALVMAVCATVNVYTIMNMD